MACALRRYEVTDSGNIPPTMRIIKPMQILIKPRLQSLTCRNAPGGVPLMLWAHECAGTALQQA
ncbi:MAG: hypothetical protein P8X89_13440 [Reinekea sp.]